MNKVKNVVTKKGQTTIGALSPSGGFSGFIGGIIRKLTTKEKAQQLKLQRG